MCPMLVYTEAVPTPSSAQQYQTELQQLYARRMAIDTLIERLQDYDRLRSKRLRVDQRKTA